MEDEYFGEEPARRRVEVKGPNFQQVPKNADWVRRFFEQPEPKWQVLEFDVGPDEDGGPSVRMITRDAPVTVVSKGRTPGLSTMSAAAAVSPVVSMALAAAAEQEIKGVREVPRTLSQTEGTPRIVMTGGRRTGRAAAENRLQALLAQAALEEGMLMMPSALTGPRRTLINVAVRNALRQWR